MTIGMTGYLFKDYTVVFDKSDIKNAKDEDFREVIICTSEKYIEELYRQLEQAKEQKAMEEQEEGEW